MRIKYVWDYTIGKTKFECKKFDVVEFQVLEFLRKSGTFIWFKHFHGGEWFDGLQIMSDSEDGTLDNYYSYIDKEGMYLIVYLEYLYKTNSNANIGDDDVDESISHFKEDMAELGIGIEEK